MSKSWMLVNSSGTTDMVAGDMDIVLDEGHVLEYTVPIQVLDQRVRKSSMEPQGSNPDAPGWGSQFRKVLGSKNLGEPQLRTLANYVLSMFSELILLQQQTAQRIALDLSEMIDSVTGVGVIQDGTQIGVRARIVTLAKTIQDIIVPQIPRI